MFSGKIILLLFCRAFMEYAWFVQSVSTLRETYSKSVVDEIKPLTMQNARVVVTNE